MQTIEELANGIRARILASKQAEQGEGSPAAGVRPEAGACAGRQHYKFPLLLAAVASGVDAIALVGPAGTGKTTAAHTCAGVLGRPFEPTSFGPTTSKADLLGFVDANGVYRDTALVRAARDGGVFLGDELDAGHPGVITGMNAVLANPVFGTPDGLVTKHADFVPVFGMNTYGGGANREYVGRNQLDAASLDRMAIIDWDLDSGLEAAMIGVPGVPSPVFNMEQGGALGKGQWLARVWTVRKAVELLGVRHIVSPRASKNGVRLFAAGVGRTHVENMVLWKGMAADTRERVEAKAREVS